jgi:hypothetical protein
MSEADYIAAAGVKEVKERGKGCRKRRRQKERGRREITPNCRPAVSV